MPGIWGDRVAGLAHHLPPHMDEQVSTQTPVKSISREEHTRPIPDKGRESTEPLGSNAAPPPSTRLLLAGGTSVKDRIGQDAFLRSTHPVDRLGQISVSHAGKSLQRHDENLSKHFTLFVKANTVL